MRDADDRQVIHSIPVGFSIDDSRGIRDPRGMIGERLGVNMHIVTAATADGAQPHRRDRARASRGRGARRQPLCRRSRLPRRGRDGSRRHGHRHGRRHDDDRRSFSAAIWCSPMRCRSAAAHVTNDIARGLSTPLAHAERLKALFGSAIRVDARRARDDRGAADRRGRGRPRQPRAEIAARQHHRAAHRGDLRDGAQPARGRAAPTRSPAAGSC